MTKLYLRDLHPKRFFSETWNSIDSETSTYYQNKKNDTATTVYVYIVAAICLTISDLSYLGGQSASSALIAFLDNPDSPSESPFYWFLIGWLKPEATTIAQSGYFELWHLSYWAIIKIISYLLLPLVAILIHPRLSLKGVGFSLKGFKSHVWVYALLFLPVFVCVVVVSFFDEFVNYYPFYSKTTRSAFDFWFWESLYILQFFALEFFFRGFLLGPTRKSMGSSAIVAMMIPYVMIHYGKPFTESIAAILAGIVLGTLAMKTRSIWAGFLLHVSIALSMDIAANMQKSGIQWIKTVLGF